MSKIRHLCTSLTLAVFLASCSKGLVKSSNQQEKIQNEVVFYNEKSNVGTYVSSWKGFRTNSFWIETKEGLIAIDTQFLTSATEEFIETAEKWTHKKFTHAIVLHPNPDKFNGTGIFQKRNVKVITSEQVLKYIPSVHKLRTEWFFERFKPDYPSEEPKPESFGNQTAVYKIGETELKLHVFNKGCSDAHVVVEYNKNLFVGDLVTQSFHSWLELGYVNDWIQLLQKLQSLEPDKVYVGRGFSGDSELLDRQIDYLKFVKATVSDFKKSKKQKLTESTKEKILNKIFNKYSSYEYQGFVETGIEAVWERL
jgi:glyoxylase-like metal-dependent hydrolase (beta-lactamase superfamily II)